MVPLSPKRLSFAVGLIAIPGLLLVSVSSAVDLNQPPIQYDAATPDNAVSRFQQQLATRKTKLTFDEETGYLKSVLAGLKVPESSQVLVFSRTSLQRRRIGPKTPRAIYFNDDVYVGFCLRGDVLELSVADPALGTVFYSLDQEPVGRPRVARQTESCLICHASSANRGFPGHLMRSVHPDRSGEPLFGSGTYRTDDTSVLDERWGGWYVTGTHGRMDHLGNKVYRDRRETDEPLAKGDGKNVTDLQPYFTTGPYLTPHSDIVALMVLGHQVAIHNRIARATLDTRSALYYRDELNKAFDKPKTQTYDSVTGRIRSAGDDLLKALLFCEEAKLTDAVKGTTAFAAEFAARGPFDKSGRSLREFDLRTRLFKYPCSFLVYSEAFDAMPADMRDYVLQRLFAVLTGKDTDKAFAHLTAPNRGAILDILRETKPNLPAYWKR